MIIISNNQACFSLFQNSSQFFKNTTANPYLIIMSLFLYGIEIWGAAYRGKYLDRIDRFF